jgi:hypothetical protein
LFCAAYSTPRSLGDKKSATTVSYLATHKGVVKPGITPEVHDNSLTIKCKGARVLLFYIHTATKLKLIAEGPNPPSRLS